MYKLIIGVLCGVLLGGPIAFIFAEEAEKRVEIAIYFGISVFFSLGIMIISTEFILPVLLRRYLYNVIGKLDRVVDHSFSSMQLFLKAQPIQATSEAKIALMEGVAWYSKIKVRTYVGRISVGVLAAFGTFLGSMLLIRQNKLIENQNAMFNRQTLILQAQTLATRFEQYNSISKEIDEIRPVTKTIQDIVENFNRDKRIEIDVPNFIYAYYRPSDLAGANNGSQKFPNIASGVRVIVLNYHFPVCGILTEIITNKTDLALCPAQDLEAALWEINLGKQGPNLPHAIALLAALANESYSVAEKLRSFAQMPSINSKPLSISAAAQKCRSNIDTDNIEQLVSNLKSVKNFSREYIDRMQGPKRNFATKNDIKAFVQTIYDLSASLKRLDKRWSFPDHNSDRGFTLPSAERIIREGIQITEISIEKLHSDCTATHESLQDMASRLDPLRSPDGSQIGPK